MIVPQPRHLSKWCWKKKNLFIVFKKKRILTYVLSFIVNSKWAVHLNIDTKTKTSLEENIGESLCDFGLLKKRNNRPKLESLGLQTKTYLHFQPLQECDKEFFLKNQSGIFWSTLGNLPDKTPAAPPQRKVPWAETILSFPLLLTLLFHPVSAYKSLPLL